MIKSNDQDTAARILDAALDVFAERGFDGTTTRAICSAAGVNLALLSYHWGGKQQLWGEVVRVLHGRLVEVARAAACEAEGALADRVRVFLDHVVGELLCDPRPIRVMAWASMQPEGFDPAVVEQAYVPVVRLGAELLRAEQARGRVPADVDVELSLVTFYGLVAEPLVEPMVHRALFGADHRDPEHAARLRRHLVASGLRLLGLQEAS
jgi:AcrR family transcriptional regulator